ncbi:hypothetical protein WN944_012274 [Citrus x changshan-huyou]|uniref:Uncharacterized protein n=1 Tax=Citrus x changshan-huyou TaxID=2935761 RepID=A0AAP0QUF7_9ROSI
MRGTSKDLLHLEHKDSSTSAIESALLVCSKKDKNGELKKPNPGKMPSYGPVPRSQGILNFYVFWKYSPFKILASG